MRENMIPKEIAKIVAKALRHDPESLSLELDPDGGWAEIEDIAYGFELNTPHEVGTPEDILSALTQANRGRFEVSGTKVRALRGHTTGEIEYTSYEPAFSHAYLCVSPRNLPYLLEHGVEPVKRRYTRLHEGVEGAVRDAKKRRRIKSPVTLRVDVAAALNNQVVFYTHDGVTYVERVPAEFLEEVEG